MFGKNDTLKVKGIAIGLLLFHHLFFSFARMEANDIQFVLLSPSVIQYIAVGARICVWIFAFLSAYGLCVQYMKKKECSNGKFIFNYWFALMKPYWFIFTTMFLLSFVLFENPLQIYGGVEGHVLLDFFALSDFFGTPLLSNACWYMCFAQVLLICIPMLVEMCKKFGVLSYIIIFILLQYLNVGIKSESGGSYTNYLLVIILGILCAQYNFFEKINKKSKHVYINVIEFSAYFTSIIFLMFLRVKYSTVDSFKITTIICSIVVLFICIICFKYLTNKLVEKVLLFLGRHSGNVFMLHSFIYLFYPKLVYWSKNVFISWVSLMALSCIASVLIEKMKDVCLYNKMMDKIKNFLIIRVGKIFS